MRIDQLCSQYEAFADRYYRKPNGKPTRHANNVRDALRLLRHTALPWGQWQVRLARLRVEQFTPSVLRALQQHEDQRAAVTRRTINERLAEIRRMFDWAADRELIDDRLPARLARVRNLKRGRCQAPEGQGVTAIDWDTVSATLAVADPLLATLIEVHWHTGMRPGELVAMQWPRIDTSREPWIYRPPEHKTDRIDGDKPLPLGPPVRMLLRHHARRFPGDVLFPGRPAGTPMTPNSYAQRLRWLHDRHGLTRWCPNQLRHAAATRIRSEHGIEAARVILGHRSARTTEIYAELDHERARRIVEQTS